MILRKNVYILILYFLISFSSKVIKNLKETALLAIPNGDALLIPTIKLFLGFPFAIGAVVLYNFLSNRFSQRTVFTSILLALCTWFLVYGLFLYPNYEKIAFVQGGAFLQEILPTSFASLSQLITYWGPTLFYLTADLLPTLVISLMLWSYLSDITTKEEGIRLFPLLAIDLPGIAAGLFCAAIAEHAIPFFHLEGWNASFGMGMVAIALSCAIALLFLYRLPAAAQEKKENNSKYSFRENLSVFARNRLLLYLGVSFFVYEAVSGLTSVVWKEIVLTLYPHPGQYSAIMGFVSVVTGIIGTISSLWIVPRLLKKGMLAFYLTPLLLFISNLLFFGAALSQTIWLSFPMVVLAIGTLYISMTEVLKIAFFDPAKELTLQELEPQERRQGKTVVDLIGKRMGKASPPILYQLLLTAGVGITALTGPIALFSTLLLGGWLVSSRWLKKYSLSVKGAAA